MPTWNWSRFHSGALAALVIVAFCGPLAAAAEPGEIDFAGDLRPVLEKYCLDCHSTEKPKGELDLARFRTSAEARQHGRVWQNVADQLASGEMPPKDKPQPSESEREAFTTALQSFLDQIALSQAGDPGPVILRRLSNAEYTYTIRDLTGIPSLDPAAEFPVDGAAGEGFMNTGGALVMSPSLLTKYLDAAREIASHAVLLPAGFRFSASTSRRDWTEEVLDQIRGFYRRYTDPRGSTRVNLQGLVWETNEGGRLPLERYFSALAEFRDTRGSTPRSLASVAGEMGLSPKYAEVLHTTLSTGTPSLLLDRVRASWRQQPAPAPATLAESVAPWQQALWKFGSVGHIGKIGGPKAWMEPVAPLAEKQEFRLKLTNTNGAPWVVIRLETGDAGDGQTDDWALWERPRIVSPGRPDLPLRDLRAVARELAASRARLLASVADCLAAADAASRHPDPSTLAVDELARAHAVEPSLLQAWLDTLGIRSGGPARLSGHFTERIPETAGYGFVQGWGKRETPNLVANRSDQSVRIPGNLKARGVAVHPSPSLQAVVSWRSPVRASLQIEAVLTHAHPECGNGVTWTLEARRGTTRQRLASGIAQGSKSARPDPILVPDFQPGDVISLLVGPRDGNHSCDLTAVDLVISEKPTDRSKSPVAEEARTWNLAADVSDDVMVANPHPDRLGHQEIWHFHTEPVSGDESPLQSLPPNSYLARWRASSDPAERLRLASEFQTSLRSDPPADSKTPDAELHRLVFAPNGPLVRSLLARTDRSVSTPKNDPVAASVPDTAPDPSPDPAGFGVHPDGWPVDPTSLAMKAPAALEFRIPAALATGSEFVVTGRLHPRSGTDGSVQFRVSQGITAPPSLANTPDASTPFVVAADSRARERLVAAFDEFRRIFPAALCYTRIVPVDEVVTLTLFYREDDVLRRLMLDEREAENLDRLWDELHFVAHDALTLVDAFAQLMEYATQDADPKVFEPLRGPIHERAARFRQLLLETEPRHVDALVDFAPRAFRRPLRPGEGDSLKTLYARLRSQELSHEDAFRMTLARVLASPAFLYRAEEPPAGLDSRPISDWELASRLAYFLWSSIPDEPLRAAAQAGRLADPEVLAGHARRMLRDPRTRRLATEFGCQWLHIHGFDQLDEKSERHFPTFADVRDDLYEEAIRFFTDFFQNDRSGSSLLDADHTFVNETLARHYGIPGIEGPYWKRVDDVRRLGRGGILGLGATLAKQSGASRTSPILRGNWISEVLLGEKLPRPPKDVPRLPEDEGATEGLTVRQLVERHSRDPRCSGCHDRIDPYGFALEGFDAIGRARARDLADRPVATSAKAADGSVLDGLDGLRSYLLGKRRDAFFEQFSRKLLGYALGRATRLSDEPLLQRLRTILSTGDGRVADAVEAIVRSRQFREIRGRDTTNDEPAESAHASAGIP